MTDVMAGMIDVNSTPFSVVIAVLVVRHEMFDHVHESY